MPRPAATVVLLRQGRIGLEVLLTKRPSTMAFAADVHVFPGGAIDPGDAAATATTRSVLSAAAAARALGGDADPDEALASYVGALRELWEEAGVALVEPRAGDRPPPRALADAREALLAGRATIGDVAGDLDLRLRTDLLAPLSRWVTPPSIGRRFDVRFFAAELPPDASPAFVGREVVDHRWSTPRAALDAMADGEIGLWIPTSTTLQQLEHVGSFDEIRERLAPGPLAPIELDDAAAAITRVVLPGAGGVPGQTVAAHIVGRRELVVVDPGDPSEAAADALAALAEGRGSSIVAIAVTSGVPDHAAGAEALALRLGVPVFGGPGSGRDLPVAVQELDDGDRVPGGDTGLVVLATPGPRGDHVAYVMPEAAAVLVGDLLGPGPSRSVTGPPDVLAWHDSLTRVAALGARRLLPAHGGPTVDVPTAVDTQRRRLPPG